MDALTLLQTVQQAVPGVIGISVGDPTDPATWRIDGVADDDLATALEALTAALQPVLMPVEVPASTGPTLDQVIAWCAGQFKVPLDDALTAITAPIAEPPTPIAITPEPVSR